MYLIVGLGNPGGDFKDTRHNVGFEALEGLAKRLGAKLTRSHALKAKIARAQIDGRDLLLMMPMTFMNRSGEAVEKALKGYDIDIRDVIVIHDEFDLAIGSLKLKKGGGSAGHNGLQSVMDSLGKSDFIRIRIGIGKPRSKELGAKYVLSKLNKKLTAELKETTSLASFAAEDIVKNGLSFSMNKYNRTSQTNN